MISGEANSRRDSGVVSEVGLALRAIPIVSAGGPAKTAGRGWLLHDIPEWIDADSSNFLVTVCCQHRGTNQLCLPGIGGSILSAARFYHEQRKWLLTLFLVMPDHIHMLVSFGKEKPMTEAVGAWKRYLSRRQGIVWQRNFFDHRLRSEGVAVEKASYILQNPVRAGLVAEASMWPYVWVPAETEIIGTARRAAPTFGHDRPLRGLPRNP